MKTITASLFVLLGGAAAPGCAPPVARVGTLLTGVEATQGIPEEVSPPSPGLEERSVLVNEAGEYALWLVWNSRDDAQAGVEVRSSELGFDALHWFDLPVTMEDDEEAPPTAPMLSIVRVPTPWYASRRTVISRFEDAVEEYRAVEGLVRKDFSLTDDDQLGGIYRWTDERSLEAFYDDAWHARIRDRYGAEEPLEVWTVIEADWADVEG